MTKLMTDAEYRANSGLYCPRCHGDDIEGGPIEVDNAEATQEITCNSCHSHWTDAYTLTGFIYFEDGE